MTEAKRQADHSLVIARIITSDVVAYGQSDSLHAELMRRLNITIEWIRKEEKEQEKD